MREDKTQIRLSVEPEFRHDRLEIVAIRTQAMQPNDAALRLLGAGDFHCFRYIQGFAPQYVKQRILTVEMA